VSVSNTVAIDPKLLHFPLECGSFQTQSGGCAFGSSQQSFRFPQDLQDVFAFGVFQYLECLRQRCGSNVPTIVSEICNNASRRGEDIAAFHTTNVGTPETPAFCACAAMPNALNYVFQKGEIDGELRFSS
jgi:hypothetical protein